MSAAPPLVRAAATVVLVRDGVGGLEVCLLRRSTRSVFVPGAFVFPGGALDPSDSSFGTLRHLADGPSDAQASACLGVEDGGLAFWVAAVRECFEEAGVLLAADAAGRPVSFARSATAEIFADHRRALDAGRLALSELCAAADVRLSLGQLAYLARWITPEGPPRRYDTRFFVARAPEHQPATPDGREVTEACWLRPAEALERHESGRLSLIWPTVRTLAVLQRFTGAEEALRTLHDANRAPATTVVEPGGGERLRLPDDPPAVAPPAFAACDGGR